MLFISTKGKKRHHTSHRFFHKTSCIFRWTQESLPAGTAAADSRTQRPGYRTIYGGARRKGARFFSPALPRALTRDSQPGGLAGGGDGPTRRGEPTEPRSGWRGGGGSPAPAARSSRRRCLRCEPREQVPLTLGLSTRTRTRKTGRAPAEGAPRGAGPGALPPPPLPLLRCCRQRHRLRGEGAPVPGREGDADLAPGRRSATCCSPASCCCCSPLARCLEYVLS
ncbi:uncharacterized protein [Equus caballus]|uniref:uncharacterized protein n=1 Tax=Equus caballus TaxID=9796 RepID=UPI0038B3BF7E